MWSCVVSFLVGLVQTEERVGAEGSRPPEPLQPARGRLRQRFPQHSLPGKPLVVSHTGVRVSKSQMRGEGGDRSAAAAANAPARL